MSVHDELVARVERARTIRMGDPRADSTEMGADRVRPAARRASPLHYVDLA
ncbi:hypothetical protein HBB16_09630 [Pseudonocardia sp. MCCB 268]|nr:hypothetical protein [Pseudonocardia cytotoxica]